MQYAIELYFDPETEEALFTLSRGIAEKGISTKFLEWKTRPHLTLACFSDVDEKACAQALRAFTESHAALPAYIGSVGMFPDTKTIFVSPIMTQAMYAFQREVHECMQDFDSSAYAWYHPGRWVPHCTVALTKDDAPDAFYKASDVVLHSFRKLAGRFTSVGLVKVSFPVEELCTADLNG